MKKNVDDFIKEHTHINYCEAIIYTDGLVEYAVPSHVEAMIRITGEDREVINEKMHIWDSPIIWLTDYTGCIPVWTQGYMLPKTVNGEQEKSLYKLVNVGLVANGQIM